MTRAVIDTNIVVSALLSDRGHEASILALIMADKLQPCLSPAILREYKDVLTRPKFRFGLTQQNAILDLLVGKAIHVADTASPFSSPDPADTKFLGCAYAANASFIITGNKRDFPLSAYGATKIVSASALLTEWLPTGFPGTHSQT